MPRPAPSSKRAPTLPVLALAVAVALVWWLVRPAGDPLLVRELVRDVLAEPETWTVLRAHPDRAPHAGVLCPSPDSALDGADMPALLMPPPAELHFRVPVGDAPLVLQTSAGVGFRVEDQLSDRVPAVTVRFEVEVDGERVFADDISVERGGAVGSEWVAVGGESGLELRPGALVALRTTLVGGGPEPDFVVPAGFEKMLLERVSERERQTSAPDRPNIVLVVQDTLRADRLSCYGYDRATSPRLDRLAARGVLFEEAYATSSWTWPSTASLLTGLLPPEHGVTDDSSPFLDVRLETVAEALQQEGFTTAAWSGNPLITPGKNFSQGFEHFEFRTSGFWKSDEIVPEVERWIRARAGTRFFLYLHLVDVHEPHLPSAAAAEQFAPLAPEGWNERSFNRYSRELLHKKGHTASGDAVPDRVLPQEQRRWMSDLYDACVYTGDEWLGRVLDALEASELDDETIVVFTSDHGEELFDHDLLSHGQTLYRELVRVPLVVAGPGLPAGRRVSTAVSNRHLAPTLARNGGAAWERMETDLFALDSLESGPLFLSTTHGFWNGWHRTPIHGLRLGDWMLHWAPEAGAWSSDHPSAGGDVRLFDLRSDPNEGHDRASERALLADEMKRAVAASLATLAARRRSPGISAGEATLELLRNIGYLDE